VNKDFLDKRMPSKLKKTGYSKPEDWDCDIYNGARQDCIKAMEGLVLNEGKILKAIIATPEHRDKEGNILKMSYEIDIATALTKSFENNELWEDGV